MTKKDREIAREFKGQISLSDAVKLIDFRVFGSRARGDAKEYSDMDVFIEAESLTREIKEKIRDIAWEIGFKHLIHISPVMFTRHEIEESPLRVSPLVKNIAEEGIAV